MFLTGATGFVGRHVAEALRRTGCTPVCLVRDAGRAAHLAAAGDVIVAGDLHDSDALTRGCAGAESVVHVAGLIAARSRTALRRVNVEGSANVAAAARAAGVRRMVLVSSLAAAGPWTEPPGRGEDEPAAPVSEYGRSKLDGEAAARAVLGREVPLTVVRPPAVYGPWDRGILEFFGAAARGVLPRLGPRPVSVVHGADLADGIVCCLGSERAAGRTYFLANRAAHTMDGLLEAIGTAVGRRATRVPVPRALLRLAGVLGEEVARVRRVVPTISRDKVRELTAPGWVCDPSRAERELGWSAATPLAEGLASTADWYRAQGWIR